MDDLISRKMVLALPRNKIRSLRTYEVIEETINVTDIEHLSPAQPEPISESYAKAVMTWLVQYQIKCAELQGRYTPYEVLGWIVNDWRKDNGIDGINQ